jgi:hypothetical protein
MPTININNEELTYNNIHYVEGINGNDSNDGSEQSPLLTVTEAYNRSVSGDAIYLIGNENANYNDYTGAINKDIDFIGDGLNSVLDFGLTSRPWQYSSANCDFYSLVVVADGLFRESGNEIYNFYNCVLRLNNGGFIKMGEQNGYVSCYNCIFDNRGLDYGAFRQGKYYENCIGFGNCENASEYGDANLINTYQNDLFVVNGVASNQGTSYSFTVNTDYTIDGLNTKHIGTGLNPDDTQANIGVYGGPYAWGDWFHILLKSNGTLYKYIDNQFIQTNDYLNDSVSDLSSLLIPDNLIKYGMDYIADDNGGKIFKKEIDKNLLKSIKQGKFSFNL